MPDWFDATPGRLYVVATLLPLAAFVVMLGIGGVRCLCRPYRQVGGTASSVYWLLGGDRPLKTGAYWATGCMAAAAALAVTGLVLFLSDGYRADLSPEQRAARWGERVDWVRIGAADSAPPGEWENRGGDRRRTPPGLSLALELGYRIDHLSALMFAMVTVIGTGIFVFSIGYMKDETDEVVEDHEVDAQTPRPRPEDPPEAAAHPPAHPAHHDGHGPGTEHGFRRRGRYGRFFLYLSLFCFSMLNLIVADNLFQVFVSWELVGLCSFFLIGFYYERPSAARAANKAFIVNRIGDAGFLVGILIAWTSLGTLNFEEMTRRVRSPERDTHGRLEYADRLVRVNPKVDEDGDRRYVLPAEAGTGSHLALFPIRWENPRHYHGLGPHAHTSRHGDGAEHDAEDGFWPDARPTYFSYGAMPYWLFVVMGLGIFLGCVGKSAQVPLHTWLPDAMEGPTPVSALIHAATMVAAGVYLVGRAFPLFAPEVLLVIAYTGAVTLFVSATIALVQTDIKRVLAYSTCSQLGYMMLALGVGGWVAGLLHLLTHAFFKALLFLGSGSVILGCHHEQDLRKMGGLYPKMRVTALTMLVGVLAITGAPLFSGWYSKDMIIGSALGFGLVHKEHILLFLLPLLTAAMTGFYMFRLWFLAFTGKPRDEHVHATAHESPAVMTLPLVVLAAFSIGVAWGSPVWDADASYLGHLLEKGEPGAVEAQFLEERHETHEYHLTAGAMALIAAALGAGLAVVVYWKPRIDPAAIRAQLGGVYTFLLRKWYFDEMYDAAVVRPTVRLAFAAAAADKRPTDAPPPPGQPELPPKRFDLLTLDGWLNALGQAVGSVGKGLRAVQTGQLRNYVLFLALTVAALLGILLSLGG
ncbi:MAG: nuoL 1 [Gemmataceae bacterium]|nr:nuoL 1 [Gemmataceae bacterium]